MKFLLPYICFVAIGFHSCQEECAMCTECEFDTTNYPQSTIDSTNCIEKEFCGDELESVRSNASDIITCPE